MLLVFDIGNSNIVLGTYEGKKLLRHWRISTDRSKTGDEYGMDPVVMDNPEINRLRELVQAAVKETEPSLSMQVRHVLKVIPLKVEKR